MLIDSYRKPLHEGQCNLLSLLLKKGHKLKRQSDILTALNLSLNFLNQEPTLTNNEPFLYFKNNTCLFKQYLGHGRGPGQSF